MDDNRTPGEPGAPASVKPVSAPENRRSRIAKESQPPGGRILEIPEAADPFTPTLPWPSVDGFRAQI